MLKNTKSPNKSPFALRIHFVALLIMTLFIVVPLQSLFSVSVLPDESGSLAGNELDYEAARTLLENKEYDTLEKRASQVLKRDPESLVALYFLYMLNFDQGKKDRTQPYLDSFETAFRSRAEISGSPSEGFEVFLQRGKNIAGVKKSRQEMINQRDDNQLNYIQIYYALASRYLSREDCQEALFWLNAAKFPTNTDEYFLGFQGYCNYKVQRFHDARIYLRVLLANATNKDIVTYSIAATYANENNVQKSLQWLQKAIEMNPKFIQEVTEDKDQDFVKIRDNPEFQAFLKSIHSR